jgi:hypothetical protein
VKILVTPNLGGWNAYDLDSYEEEIDYDGCISQHGMYFSDTTRAGALNGLIEQYEDAAYGSDDTELQLRCSLAIVEIKKLLEDK